MVVSTFHSACWRECRRQVVDVAPVKSVGENVRGVPAAMGGRVAQNRGRGRKVGVRARAGVGVAVKDVEGSEARALRKKTKRRTRRTRKSSQSNCIPLSPNQLLPRHEFYCRFSVHDARQGGVVCFCRHARGYRTLQHVLTIQL